jgi:uncharacterized protein YqeY
MLIETLHKDMVSARQGKDSVAKNLLVTLYSEALMVGKNKRNGNPTDDEVLATIKKFAANVDDTIRNLQAINRDAAIQQREADILHAYLPQQIDRITLEAVVHSIVHEMKLEGAKAMGAVMAELKKNYTGRYDGKMASEVVKLILS